MKKKIILGLVITVATLAMAGCGKVVEETIMTEEEFLEETDNGVSSEVKIDGPVFAFEDLDLEGTLISSEELFSEHELTMVNIWATFCSPCIAEMPDLELLYPELEANDIGLVGIVSDVTDYAGGLDDTYMDLARQIVDETGVTYTNIAMANPGLIDEVITFDAVPTTFFVNRDGVIVSETYIGSQSKDYYYTLAMEIKNSLQ